MPPSSATYGKDVSMNRKEAFVDAFVVPLERLGRDDLVRAGGKGANLGELVRAGFPVPDGFIITTAAYDGFVAHNHLGETIAWAVQEQQGNGAGIRSAFEAAPIPPEIERDILAAYRKQIRTMMWLGLVFGVAGIGLALVEDRPGGSIIKLVGAAIWLAVSGIAFTSLRALERIPDTGPVANAGAS